MKILYLETSSKNCSVAISDDGKILCVTEEISENYKQSESLHVFVEWALEGAGISMKDIGAVTLGKGPGSYTGLRIGASSAKGFCYGLKVPLIAVNSMESIIVPFLGRNYDYIIPLIDARRMEVYTAVYDGKNGMQMSDTGAKILDETSFEEYKDKKILFVGDGVTKAKDLLQLPDAGFNAEVYPSARYLVNKTLEKIKKKEFEDIAYFEPFYLKDFHGVKKKNKSEE
jgi:tRNA threonylcarbamoyladenosine biosynthesis protein TsaB